MNPKFVFENAIKFLQKSSGIVESDQFKNLAKLLSVNDSYTTGMGKASLVAQKLSTTLACIGRSSSFIHPGDALHGGVGAIKKNDVLVASTNSGKTYEVLETIKKAKIIGATIAVITGCICDEIKDNADIIVFYDKITEACPLGLTPTTSIIVMMAIVDSLAFSVQQSVGLSYEEYSIHHHSGYLGQVAKEKAKNG